MSHSKRGPGESLRVECVSAKASPEEAMNNRLGTVFTRRFLEYHGLVSRAQ